MGERVWWRGGGGECVWMGDVNLITISDSQVLKSTHLASVCVFISINNSTFLHTQKSPWYNHDGRLGIKHQVTQNMQTPHHLPPPPFCCCCYCFCNKSEHPNELKTKSWKPMTIKGGQKDWNMQGRASGQASWLMFRESQSSLPHSDYTKCCTL